MSKRKKIGWKQNNQPWLGKTPSSQGWRFERLLERQLERQRDREQTRDVGGLPMWRARRRWWNE